MEDRRYAVLSGDTVRMFGESVGFFDLPEDLVSMLAEDVTYRLREVIQNSCQFLRHARRKKLTAEDVNKSLKNSDTPVIHGYGTPEVLPFRQTREGDIYCVEDLDINLPNIACSSQGLPSKPDPLLKAHWLAVEGVQKTSTLPLGLQAKLSTKGSPGISDELLQYYDNVTRAILSNDAEIMKLAFVDLRTNTKITPLMPYFTNFFANGVRTVNYDVTQLTKLLHTVRALNNNYSLSLQPKPFLELIVQGILCCVIEPLAASINPLNDHWRLRDYASRLLAQVTNRWGNSLNNLRERNIKALQVVLCDVNKPSCSHYGAIMGLLAFGTQAAEDMILPHLPQLWTHIHRCMADNSYANIPTKSDAQKVQGALLLAADYIVKARVIETLTSPVDDLEASPPTPLLCQPTPPNDPAGKVNDFDMNVEKSDSSEMGLPQIDAPDLMGPVLTLPETRSSYKSLAELYAELYEYFGDSVAARNPVRNVDGVYVVRKKEVRVSLRDDEESKKSGEELLKQFGVDNMIHNGEMPELEEMDTKSSQTADDMEYDVEEKSEKSERSSRSSRSHSDENLSYLGEDTDLTVKATVSDPSQGIKLTILKRPKMKMPSMNDIVGYEEYMDLKSVLDDEVPMPVLDAKPAPLPMEIQYRVSEPKDINEVFEIEPMIQNNVLFVFRFLGCQQVYNAKRNSKRMQEFEVATRHSNEVEFLRKGIRTYGKRKVVKQNKKKWSPLHFYSGNINCIL